MSNETDLIKLYSQRILALAADIPFAERLDAPMASVKKRAPLCGSTVTVDLDVADGVITRFGQDVKACALGQASASIMAANIIGRSVAEVENGRNQLRNMLKEGGPKPEAPFEGYEVLVPAREYGNRHASIMLAFEATLEAMGQANAAACA